MQQQKSKLQGSIFPKLIFKAWLNQYIRQDKCQI